MANFTGRMIGASKLDVHTYEEVEADTSALGQAMVVVVLSSLATGIGHAGGEGASNLMMAALAALLAWLCWAWLTYFIGTRILPSPQTHADWGELLRTTGFAAAPGVLRILGIVPVIGTLVFSFVSIWMLVAFIVAVRQALDYTSTGRAIGVCAIGWLASNVIFIVLSGILG